MPATQRARIFCVDPMPKTRAKVTVLGKLYLSGWAGNDLIVSDEPGDALWWPDLAAAEHAIKVFHGPQKGLFHAEAVPE